MKGEIHDDYGIRMDEENFKEENDDERLVDDEHSMTNAVDEDYNEVTIGEPALTSIHFNIYSPVLYSHNFYRKFRIEDGSFRASCLMCWKRDRTHKVFRIKHGNIKSLLDHMASKHAEYVEKYLSLRQKIEKMKVETKQQKELDSIEQSRKKIERKQKREQDVHDTRMKKLNNKQEFWIQKKQLQLTNDENDMAEKVLEEEFTIGEPSDLNFSVFASVYYSHNFYRKTKYGSRVLCLMCLRDEDRNKVFLRIPDGNVRGILGHMESFHPEYAKKFTLQNEIIKGLRNEEREKRLHK